MKVRVYEQASAFARVGAGVQQSPNAVRVLREFGLESRLREAGFYPMYWRNRESETGALTHHYALGAEAEKRFGAPYLLLHRGDLHAAIASIVPGRVVHLNKKAVGIDQTRVRFTPVSR